MEAKRGRRSAGTRALCGPCSAAGPHNASASTNVRLAGHRTSSARVLEGGASRCRRSRSAHRAACPRCGAHTQPRRPNSGRRHERSERSSCTFNKSTRRLWLEQTRRHRQSVGAQSRAGAFQNRRI
eukprot:2295862-Pleurochrysis_carterae.AAC.1